MHTELRPLATLIVLLVALTSVAASAAERRRITEDDFAKLVDVGDPQVSPDGEWVAYTVSSVDPDADGWQTDLWMTSWDGRRSLQLTHSWDSETQPRFSPDGRYVAFLSARDPDNDTEQLWLLDRSGGEAERLSDLPGDITDYAWSPDGRHIALIVADPDPNATLDDDATRPPIVIDRFYFKEDETGYLGKQRRHLYLLDVESGEATLLTPGSFDELRPSWSPDGQQIAFVSKRTGDPDRNDTFGVYVMAPRVGATQRLVTTFECDAADSPWMTPPAWSPDGRQLAIVVGGDPKLIYYGTHRLAVVPVTGGAPQVLTGSVDRNVEQPHWSRDGRWLYFLMEENRSQFVARVRVSGGPVERVTHDREEILAIDAGGKGRMAVLRTTPLAPLEVFALEGGRVRPLSRQNDALLGELELAEMEETRVRSADGTEIFGFLVRPIDAEAGRRYPAVLENHGGPAWQFANRFEYDWQLLAAKGFAVIAANPRGSTGRGEAFATGIYADWGNKDVRDVLAAVDDAVNRGVADPARLGVFGWSYGGILTNHVIVEDQRFKAAISGAGQGNPLAGYGTDMYIREYERELGPPWRDTDTWIKLSKPFLHADRITTPTLFMCGEADYNVSLLNSEQMYQALRSLNVPTQLIIYPGESHGLSRLSYLQDRTRRRLEWFARYLK